MIRLPAMGTITRMRRCLDCGLPLGTLHSPPHVTMTRRDGTEVERHEVCYALLMAIHKHDLVRSKFKGMPKAWDEIVTSYAQVPREEWPEGYRKARSSMAVVREIQRSWRHGLHARQRLRDAHHAC